MQLKELLQQMIDAKASDVFIIAGLPLSYQKSGIQVRTDSAPLMPGDTEEYIAGIYELANRDIELFRGNDNHDDKSWSYEGGRGLPEVYPAFFGSIICFTGTEYEDDHMLLWR